MEEKEANKIRIPEIIGVRDLAERSGLSVSQIIGVLIKYGMNVTINDDVDFETIAVVSEDLGIDVEKEEEKKTNVLSVADILKDEDKSKMKERPPVVTIMGHVDHGKTSLLDYIRETKVAEKEAGLITQHIGAYQIEAPVKNSKKTKKITFIDTPGHEAFAAIRAHGALVTDIAILVVDASDDIRPQTLEAIEHARGAKVPIIVAITKIDRPEANIEKIKKSLMANDLTPEDWGGKTICVPVSAKTGEGVDDLLEMIILVSEMEELKANPNGKIVGTVIESHMESSKGSVATVLVQNGTLEIGQAVACGGAYGKVRAMEDFRGKKMKKAEPSDPVKLLGLQNLPEVGDILNVVETDKEAKALAEAIRKESLAKKIKPINIQAANNLGGDGGKYVLKIILKADVAGSLTALHSSLLKIGDEEAKVQILAEGIGDISESDIMMSSNTGAKIFGFHINIDEGAKKAIKIKNVKIYTFDVIYDLIDKVHKELEAILPMEVTEEITGSLTVLEIFKKKKGSMIAGGKVKKGVIANKSKIKVLREDEYIGEGKITNLQVQKKESEEAKVGQECGMELALDDLTEGDTIECYKTEKTQRRL